MNRCILTSLDDDPARCRAIGEILDRTGLRARFARLPVTWEPMGGTRVDVTTGQVVKEKPKRRRRKLSGVLEV